MYDRKHLRCGNSYDHYQIYIASFQMQIIAPASNMGRKQNLAHFSYMGEEFGPKGIALVVVVGVREIVGIVISSLDRIALERNC